MSMRDSSEFDLERILLLPKPVAIAILALAAFGLDSQAATTYKPLTYDVVMEPLSASDQISLEPSVSADAPISGTPF
jgi:hypothetical protein